MMLDSIQPRDVPIGQVYGTREDTQALRTQDIEGASSARRYRHWQKDAGKKVPIPGTVAKSHYPDVNRPVDLSLDIRDLPGARPDCHRFTTPRVVDPMQPRYPLPSVAMVPKSPPRAAMHQGQERDWQENRDAPRQLVPNRNYDRDPNEGRDIECSQTSFRLRMRKGVARDLLSTRDINGEVNLTMMRKTPRESHPLEPTYDLCGRTTHPFRRGEESAGAPPTAGEIEKSRPRALTRDNGEPQCSLIREDIHGTVPQRYKGAVPFNIYDSAEVTPYSQFYGCQDIEGTQVGTRKPGTL